MKDINEQITHELLEKERNDPEFRDAIIDRQVEALEYFDPWIMGDVFEIGCRHGIMLQMLEKLPRVENTFGIDLSKEAIDILKSKELNGEVQLAETLIESPYLYGLFHTVVCLHTLEHCTDIPKVIAGIWEVLKPGCGHALIEIPLQPKEPTPTVWGHNYCFETEQELIDMFEGFTHVRTFRKEKHTWRRFVFKK